MLTSDEFVAFFSTSVYRSGIASAISSLTEPPGRRPAPDLARASMWYVGLSDREREFVDFAMAAAAHAVAFGALAMIDGVRPSGPERYELVAVGPNGERTIVNPVGVDLHDLFQTEAMRSDGTMAR